MIYIMVKYVWWIDIAMIWYVEGTPGIYYVIVMIYDMIWYVYNVNIYVWKYGNVLIWYICDMKWYDWHARRRTNMKFNSDIRMKAVINNMINDMRNDMTKWYDIK